MNTDDIHYEVRNDLKKQELLQSDGQQYSSIFNVDSGNLEMLVHFLNRKI